MTHNSIIIQETRNGSLSLYLFQQNVFQFQSYFSCKETISYKHLWKNCMSFLPLSISFCPFANDWQKIITEKISTKYFAIIFFTIFVNIVATEHNKVNKKVNIIVKKRMQRDLNWPWNTSSVSFCVYILQMFPNILADIKMRATSVCVREIGQMYFFEIWDIVYFCIMRGKSE